MGIKGYVTILPGDRQNADLQSIYSQIGPGERVALSKLAVEHYERQSRPLKLAIDISIWNFQTQSGQGGQNPVLRTLYYRLLRLLSLAIRPLFVFDGPNKPPFKRNKKTGYHSASLPDYLTKQLLKQFGFPFHTAPGEAEAECASLQRSGIVDVVLSEDVDTLMFGCGVTIRNWSKEGTKGNKTPTHVNLYKAETTHGTSGLDHDGMILVALMSGGDYVPAGIPGCGVKTACEAARAGFGKDLCKVSKNDTAGHQEWRDWLEHELHTNESGFFRTKHSALEIPEDFPKKDVLGYYTDPVVSNPEKLLRLSLSIAWDIEINVSELRGFVAEAFEWVNRSGAVKFIRGLAPALLVDQLQRRGVGNTIEASKGVDRPREESQIIKAVCGRRKHFVTDGLPELRLAYVPINICGLNLEQEATESSTGELDNHSETENVDDDNDPSDTPTSPKKTKAPTRYDPVQPEKTWILETFAKVGAAVLVESWEEEQRVPKSFATRKARERKQVGKGGMNHGALDAFVKITKPATLERAASKPSRATAVAPESSQTTCTTSRTSHDLTSRALATPREKRKKPSESSLVNPWTLSKRPSDTFNAELPSGTRYSALGIYSSGSKNDTSTSHQPDFDDPFVETATTRLELSLDVHEKRTTPRSHSSMDDSNVTVRRKRKAKPLTKAFTAPCGKRDIIDLDSPEGSPYTGSMQRPIIDELALCGEHGSAASSTQSLYLGRPKDAVVQAPIRKEGAQGGSGHELSTSKSREAQKDRESHKMNRVNCRSNLARLASPSPASPTSSDTLPSPSTLICRVKGRTLESQGIETDSLAVSPSINRREGKSGKSIMLRESLEGAWRDVETSHRTRKPARAFSNVSVVDLTSE